MARMQVVQTTSDGQRHVIVKPILGSPSVKHDFDNMRAVFANLPKGSLKYSVTCELQAIDDSGNVTIVDSYSLD